MCDLENLAAVFEGCYCYSSHIDVLWHRLGEVLGYLRGTDLVTPTALCVLARELPCTPEDNFFSIELEESVPQTPVAPDGKSDAETDQSEVDDSPFLFFCRPEHADLESSVRWWAHCAHERLDRMKKVR